MTRLLVALSGHGFGHAAQTAPLVAALVRRLPKPHLTVRTALPPTLLHGFLPIIDVVSTPDRLSAPDFGAVMRSPFEVDGPATVAGYVDRHRRYEVAVEVERTALIAARPDLVIANISYVTLTAAASLGIPAIAFSSLNWLEIYRHYAVVPDVRIVAEMLAGYRSARLFLTPEPAMAMPDLRITPVGPIARLVPDSAVLRGTIAARIGLQPDERMVLVSLGGIPGGIDPARWPAEPGIRVIVAGYDGSLPDHIVDAGSIGLPHLDLLAGVDVLVTKPGYGSFVEAAAHGVPVLHVPRDDWPEAPALVAWLERVANAAELSRNDLANGLFAAAARRLWSRQDAAPVPMTGAEEAARLIAKLLG